MIAPFEDVRDHPLKTHFAAVFRRVDARDAYGMEFFGFLRQDDAAATAENQQVLPAGRIGAGAQIFEELHVAALVGADRDRMGVFLHGRLDDLADAAIVAEVDHLGTALLEQTSHDIHGDVVAVEKGGGCDDPDLVPGFVDVLVAHGVPQY
ncbi:MAG: hypothetical protein BWY66_02863 [bacterium ADurb.Bin374]|nr:MAG: hypothetical protein BWY66_02863 [bacterium ADurb.Bin374]